MIAAPSSRICGRTNMTSPIEITVPRPRHWPMPQIVGSEVIMPIRKPETARIVPEVMIVGKAKFIVSMMASRWDIWSFRSL